MDQPNYFSFSPSSVVNKLSLTIPLLIISSSLFSQNLIDSQGAVYRSDTTVKTIYLCFTGHDYIDGFEYVLGILDKHDITGSFFFTGDFIRENKNLVIDISRKGHFVGPHSDGHLLYCDWTNRDSLLYTEEQIKEDILLNRQALNELAIYPHVFMPPYEWYNTKVVEIASQLNLITVSFTPGTRSNADYTSPGMANYISSNDILKSINQYKSLHNLNGFHLLIHPGTSPERTDKFYYKLDELITGLLAEGYQFSTFSSY